MRSDTGGGDPTVLPRPAHTFDQRVAEHAADFTMERQGVSS